MEATPCEIRTSRAFPSPFVYFWKRQKFLIALGGTLLGLFPAMVAAETCLEQAHDLAETYNLNIDPPDATFGQQSDKISDMSLGRSGGLIEAPPVSSPNVIKPPPEAGRSMPTAPDITPGATAGKHGGITSLSAADLSALEGILVAARAAARRGDEANCLARLQKGKTLLFGDARR